MVELAEMRSEVNHLRSDLTKQETSVAALVVRFQMVAQEVHHLSNVVRWTALLISGLILTVAGAMLAKGTP